MSKQRSEIERSAYHEAGHAVAAWLVEVPFTTVTIAPGEENSGHVACDFSRWAGLPQLDSDDDPDTILRAKRKIFVALAGYASERVRFGQPAAPPEPGLDAEHDVYQADKLCRALTTWRAMDEAAAHRQFMWEQAGTQLRYPRHRLAVRAVARRLLEKKTLEYDEVRQIIEGIPGGLPQINLV